MKRTNKKGFTIVELVIVIAVIAILAAVLIPTFSNVIEKSHHSACLQEAKTTLEQTYADDMSDGKVDTMSTGLTTGKSKGIQAYTASADGTYVATFTYCDGTYVVTYTAASADGGTWGDVSEAQS